MQNSKPRTDDTQAHIATAPKYIAHWVVKTSRRREMIAWYETVFNAKVVHSDRNLTFLSWDGESHRLALVNLPRPLRYLFPLAKLRRKVYGIDHIAFAFESLTSLLYTYARIKTQGIKPIWCINHGPTTSMYYEDPDGNRLEFQVDNYPSSEETKRFLSGPIFEKNPIGVNFDPEYLLERLNNGESERSLLSQNAGVRPGTTQPSNMKAINWRTL